MSDNVQQSHKLDVEEAYRLTVESIYKRILETASKGEFKLKIYNLPEPVVQELEDNGFIVINNSSFVDAVFGDTAFEIKWD